jgi:hypothetical protein
LAGLLSEEMDGAMQHAPQPGLQLGACLADAFTAVVTTLTKIGEI